MSKGETTDKYFLENNDELARLAAQHALYKYEFKGQLLMRPILDDLKKRGKVEVLESATAGGLWMRELAEELPKATFVGTDIATSFFPTSPDPPFTYVAQDIMEPWPESFHERFDLVHQRLVLGAIQNRAKLEDAIAALAGTVKPGGWIQIHEADCAPDILPSSNGPAMQLFTGMMAAFSPNGDLEWCRKLKPILEKLGFEHVQDKALEGATGVACGDKELGMRHAKLCHSATTGMAAAFKGMFDDKDLETLPERWDREMEVQGGYVPTRLVWGRKKSA